MKEAIIFIVGAIAGGGVSLLFFCVISINRNKR